MDDKPRMVTIRMEAALWKRLKLWCLDHNGTLQGLIVRLCIEHLNTERKK